jgi:hypothetical protein
MNQGHWVYVFARKGPSGLTAPVKVGISNNVKSRLATIQTACPYPIDLAYVFECPDRDIAREIEKSFHAVKKDYRTHGEWFDFEPIEAIHILCIAFRAALSHNIKDDPDLIDRCLSACGVHWAEKRFDLIVPTGSSVQ